MANSNHFTENAQALFKGMESFINTKTVIGDPVQVGDATILPLVDVTCGMGSGSFAKQAKESNGGGMSAKMSPAAVLIIQNGNTRLVTVRNQSTLTHIIDMIPDLLNKLSGKDQVSEEALDKAEEIAKGEKTKADTDRPEDSNSVSSAVQGT